MALHAQFLIVILALLPASLVLLHTAKAAAGDLDLTFGSNGKTTSHVEWITITSDSSAAGNGVVGYSVAANSKPSGRKGTIAIAGQTSSVKQNGR